MDIDIITALLEELKNGRNVALVIITENKGSVPGAKYSSMLVCQNGETLGTIGGGPIEYDIIKNSLKALEDDEEISFDYTLTEKDPLNMSCGGSKKGYVKIFRANPRLIIFGAGHVGQKLARIASRTNFDVVVVDKREEYKNKEDFKEIKKFVTANPDEYLKNREFNQNTYIVICTPDYDEDVLTNVIKKQYKYLGMLGSKRKVKKIFDNLKEKGVDQKIIDGVHSPIGYDIGDGSVEEIAISILSEMLSVKNNKIIGG